jgi:L-serine dehydratase
MVKSYPEFFNDVFGPIMQTGSSSHMAAPNRLGYLAYCLLDEEVKKAEFIMDKEGSFAGTFGLMKENLGMLSGVLGMMSDDPLLFEAEIIAQKKGIEYSYKFESMKESLHLNSLKIVLTGKSGKMASVVGDSTGGGMIETKVVNGYPLSLKGDSFVLLITGKEDKFFTAKLKTLRAGLKGKIGGGRVNIPGNERTLFYYNLSVPPDQFPVKCLFPDCEVEVLKPVLPVVTTRKRKKQLFDSLVKWRDFAEKNNLSLSEAAIQYEINGSGWDRGKVIDYMKMIERKMFNQTHKIYEEKEQFLMDKYSFRGDLFWKNNYNEGKKISGAVISGAIKSVLGVITKKPGIEIVPGPMGTGGGYLYSALYSVKESGGYSDGDLLRGLFIAAGVGAIAYTRTSPTGEVIGCTGECGICSAMTAAAITEMAGGTGEQVENAASLALQGMLGIPCDPVSRGEEQPCFSRIVIAVTSAIVFADLALAGKSAVLPFHEVVDAADKIGRNLPSELLCTSKGGCCGTPTAKRKLIEYKKHINRTKEK